MPTPVDLIDFAPTVRAFLDELSQNNNRDWFRRQKGRYDAEVKRPAERLLDTIAPRLEAETGKPVRTKLFRPHRDVRFSEDKTPYHVHLHAAWTVPDGRAWYFGLSPEYATLGAGIMSFDEEQLENWREAVASGAGNDLTAMLDDLDARIGEPELDEVPDPWEADHPNADLLRRKSLVVWLDGLFDALTPDPAQGLDPALDRLNGVQDWLARNL
ncbi:TIGR02453 family protein [Salipiger sp.]|uniref:TIGR02453 family protein n=1 Tax=Salipiger sp. TaxID=2078585 RepID=UPI003A96F9A3